MNDLTDLLERSTADLAPDVAGLVAGGITRGRRLRTRRRLTTGAGALATVAVVGVGAVLLPSLVAGSPTAPRTTPPAAANPAPEPAVRELPSRAALAHGSVVELPAGRATLLESHGARDFVAASWKFAPADGSPAARVEVLIEKLPLVEDSVGPEPTLVPDGLTDPDTVTRFRVLPGRMPPSSATYDLSSYCHADGGTCHALGDGTWADTSTLPEPLSGGGDSDVIGAHASLWTVDGFNLVATAYNAMSEKGSEPTRAAAVLDEAQLLAILRAADLG